VNALGAVVGGFREAESSGGALAWAEPQEQDFLSVAASAGAKGSPLQPVTAAAAIATTTTTTTTSSTSGGGSGSASKAASSVKRPESAAVDAYIAHKLLPAYANHLQVLGGSFHSLFF